MNKKVKPAASQTYYQIQVLLSNPEIKNALLTINFPDSSKIIEKHIQEALSKFGFSNLDTNILNSLKQFIRTKDPNRAYLRNVTKIKFIPNEEASKDELWIRIHPYTKKEDFEKVWRQIEEFQKQLPDYVERERERKAFKRDIGIFWEYCNYRKSLKTKDKKRTVKTYDEFYPRIERKYKIKSFVATRKIISRINKLLLPLK